MAKSKTTKPTIIVDGVSREMTSDEETSYNKVTSEASQLIDSAKQKQQNKEAAVAKLVALGLTEEDLRSVGL